MPETRPRTPSERQQRSLDLMARWPREYRTQDLKDTSPMGPEGLSRSRERLAELIFKTGALKIKPTSLSLHKTHPDAPLSPVYVDLRLLQTDITGRNAALRTYQELMEDIEYNLISGVPNAGTIPASMLADRESRGILLPTKLPKTHGGGGRVYGIREEHRGKSVLLVEDTLSTGQSAAGYALILNSEGANVRDLITLLDRQHGGGMVLGMQGIKVHSAIALPQMMSFYQRAGLISESEYNTYQDGNNALNRYLRLI